jgi:type I restriction enzyme S subunit
MIFSINLQSLRDYLFLKGGKMTENNLPEGWVECSLGEILLSKKGKKPSETINEPRKGYVPYILIDELEGKTIRAYTNDPKVSIIDENHILLVWDGSIGKCGSSLKGAIGSTLVGLKPLDKIPTRFIEYTIKHNNNFIKETSTGTGLQHINKDFFEICKISLPPLGEQQRIVAKLDALMEKVESNKQRLQKIPILLKRFRQSVLSAEVRGRLTEDWREKNRIVEKLKWVSLENLIKEGPQNGLYKPQSSYGSGTMILRINNFYDGEINEWNTLKRLTIEDNEYKIYALQNDDIIVNRVNSIPFLGKSAIVRNLPEPCVFESNMMRIKFNNEIVSPFYIIRYLNSMPGLEELRKNAKHAVNQASINQKDVKAVLVPLPTLKEQNEIVRRIEQLFAFADKIETRYTKAKAILDKLPQSILSKAFRGELVPQDPDDEPARVLLERIRAEKEKLGRKGDKKRKPRT